MLYRAAILLLQTAAKMANPKGAIPPLKLTIDTKADIAYISIF